MDCHASGCMIKLPLRGHVRIMCIDARRVRWCLVDSAAFHSFVWPRDPTEAKNIAHTLFINHCGWADVLVVRGR